MVFSMILVIIGVFQIQISQAVDDSSDLKLSGSYDKLSWFIHISDVHISS